MIIFEIRSIMAFLVFALGFRLSKTKEITFAMIN